MIRSADSIYLTGSTHTNCQDYAAVKSTSDGGIIIALSDGCSSSPKTDVGARILVETFLSFPIEVLMDHFGNETHPERKELGRNIFRARIFSAWQAIGLPEHAFDATLLALIHHNNRLIALFWGDGHLRINHTDGSTTTLDVDYDENGNAPYYPGYEIFKDGRSQKYRTQFGEPSAYRRWRSDILPDPNELHANEVYPIFELPTETIESISIFSDGAGSFLRDRDPIPSDDILDQCCSFKSTEGQLVTRRINKCRKLWHKESIQHTDDFSMATIHFQKNETTEPKTPLD